MNPIIFLMEKKLFCRASSVVAAAGAALLVFFLAHGRMPWPVVSIDDLSPVISSPVSAAPLSVPGPELVPLPRPRKPATLSAR